MTITWQNGRQLATLQKGTTALSYTYDASDTRATKTVNGEKYTYQYLNGKLIHETRGEKSFNYYYDANGYLTAIKYRLTPTGDEYSYYVTLLGAETSSASAPEAACSRKYEYDAWGQRVKKTVRRTVFSNERHSRCRAAGGVAVATVRARLPTRTTLVT